MEPLIKAFLQPSAAQSLDLPVKQYTLGYAAEKTGMERPGLLEFAVYALVLAASAGWVYALPPFTPGPREFRSAQIQPATVPSQSQQTAIVTPAGNQEEAQIAAAQPVEPAGGDPNANLLVVTAKSLNMRSSPNAGSDLVRNLPRGTRVQRLEIRGNWVLVRADDDTMGWMYAGYLGAAD